MITADNGKWISKIITKSLSSRKLNANDNKSKGRGYCDKCLVITSWESIFKKFLRQWIEVRYNQLNLWLIQNGQNVVFNIKNSFFNSIKKKLLTELNKIL